MQVEFSEFSFVYYIYPSAIAGYVFALLVEHVGWGGAGLWELTVFPAVGIIAMFGMQGDKINHSKHQETKKSMHA